MGAAMDLPMVDCCGGAQCARDERTQHAKSSQEMQATSIRLARDLVEIDERAPLTAVPFARLRALGRLPRSDEGAAVPPAPGDHLVFVSHRWLRPWTTRAECEAHGAEWAGAPHPDDGAGTKHRTLLRGIEMLAAERGWPLDRVGVWLDYACISQDDAELKALGIRSLLGYAARCALVLVPCESLPKFPVVHEVKGGYGERGWTKLEAFTFYVLSLLRHLPRPELYCCTLDGAAPLRLDFNVLPDSMPSGGVLYSEADRAPIRAHEHTLLDALHAAALQEAAAAAAPTGRDDALAAAAALNGCAGPALVAAAALGDRRRVDELLAARVDVDARDRRGYTALISAARYDRRAVVHELLRAGARHDLTTLDGWTPLVMCARKGHAEMAAILLDAGAGVNLPYGGKSPLDIALEKGNGAVADALRARGGTRLCLSSETPARDPVDSASPSSAAAADDGANDRGFPLTSREQA